MSIMNRAALVLLVGGMAAAEEPQLTWSYAAKSNLYAPPLVVDIHPAPGLETILSDSEVRRLRCIDATGSQLWEFAGGWSKRLPSAASLSTTAHPDKALLLIGNGDGMLCCIDASTGVEEWRKQVGVLEWGVAIWADLDGDGRDEAIAGTADAGVAAFSAGGEPLWTCATGAQGMKLDVTCPIGAADIDGDGKVEVFAVDKWGPLCLNADGALRWSVQTGDEFASAPIIADADGDGAPELYCSSRNGNAVHRFDALTGAHVWAFTTVGGADVYPGSSMAVGDIDGGGGEEIVAADNDGHVYCIDPDGNERWRFVTEKPTHAAVTLGDVDGDREVEVLVACGDHYLYCLNHYGDLEWRYAAGLRLMYPATISDVDQDGMTDILFCGSDRTLRCLTLGGRYDTALIPWPSRRFDATQSGSSFGRRGVASDTVTEEESLFAFCDFEHGKKVERPETFPSGFVALRENQPQGWQMESGNSARLELVSDEKNGGERSARVKSKGGVVTMASHVVAVSPALRCVDASVWVKTEAAVAAHLRWSGTKGVIAQAPLAGAGVAGGSWRQLSADDAVPPTGARWLQLVCEVGDGTDRQASAWWDDAELLGTFERPRTMRALVNQVGYDVGAPKLFTAQSNFKADDASFELVDEQGATVFKAPLVAAGRITGAHGHDWGYEYWRGDFSSFDTPGAYRVRMVLDGSEDTSWPFEVAPEAVWTGTSRPAYRFFYYQRCGMAIPGFHGACHLDDAVSEDGKQQFDLAGGWHDAGDYNTYHNAPYVWGLVQAYTNQKARFDLQDEDGNGLSDFLDEIIWGGDHSRRMIAPDGSAYGHISSGYGFWGPPELETDNVPGTGDERPVRGASATGHDSSTHCAATARIARFVKDKAPYVEAADRALKWGMANGKRGVPQLSAALDLFAVTGDDAYAAMARELLPTAGLDAPDVIEAYDAAFGTDHRAALRDHFVARAENMLALADNPFGVYTRGPAERPNFFGAPSPDGQGGWHVGTSTHVLSAAGAMAVAYRFEPDPRYLRFVYDQFNWTLGNNPYDICLLEGRGSANPPTYHHRYTFGGVPRGAVPGSVVNGITWRGVGDDRPYFDMRGLDIPAFEPNEVWLPHNTAYLNALANLERSRADNRRR
jgi:outer membrane protein assembly factor BamB